MIASRRLVSMATPHLAALETTIEAENWAGTVVVRSALDGAVTNAGVTRYRDLEGHHLEPVASVHTAWQYAKKHDRWVPKGAGIATPGDAFVILHKDPEDGWCTGHIGFVLQVAEDGKSINTVEGNCGNRVKVGRRELSDPMLRGFINIVGDQPEFTRGSLRGAPELRTARTR